MNHPIYLLISIVIGTSIILILTRTTVFINESQQEELQEEKVLQNFITTQQILEYYLKKIGFRSPVNPIIEADSLKIKFYCDEDGDGLVDSLEIRIGELAENSQNPSDYKLILVKNSNEQTISPYGVTKFKFDYLDVNGIPTNEKLFIRFIIVSLRIESEYPVNGCYLFFEDKFIVRPKNIG
ncbi:MAG: hypothetical protein WHV63_00790 [Ignavibacteria bacterium]|nr:hypothetical protein [Ignavibacteria bacterium]